VLQHRFDSGVPGYRFITPGRGKGIAANAVPDENIAAEAAPTNVFCEGSFRENRGPTLLDCGAPAPLSYSRMMGTHRGESRPYEGEEGAFRHG